MRAERLAGRSAGLGEEEGLGFISVCPGEICLVVVCDYGWGCATLYRRGRETMVQCAPIFLCFLISSHTSARVRVALYLDISYYY
jgi:hypothetical protein